MEPDYKWIAQDEDGKIFGYRGGQPKHGWVANEWYNDGKYKVIKTGNPNPNWRDSLIDIEKEDYEIIDGILVRKPRAEVLRSELTDTELLDAIVEHELLIDVTNGVVEVRSVRTFALSNKKGDIRKAIKKWLRKNT